MSECRKAFTQYEIERQYSEAFMIKTIIALDEVALFNQEQILKI